MNTCDEKQEIASRVLTDARLVQPVPPALRIFDAGMGDATVLTRVMRQLHHRHPTVPLLVVGKETSQEDVRISLRKMPDRFQEHPQTVLVVTNMFYSEAPGLRPRSVSMQARLNWVEVPLTGSSAFEFDEQIAALEPSLEDWWRTTASQKTGNPIYATPSVLVIYRDDQRWPLEPVIPRRGEGGLEYDIIIAAQPYRARSSAESKVKNVLGPLARSLARGGCMVAIQSTGKDPGMEIIRKIWPGENPFNTPRQTLLRELQAQLGDVDPTLRYLSYTHSQAEFRFSLRVGPDEVSDTIGTSTLLAAWNAATYVAQIEDDRLEAAMGRSEYLEATQEVLQKYSGLWFTDESFIVART